MLKISPPFFKSVLIFCLFLFFITPAAAKQTHKMKFVFPFGDNDHQTSVCDINYRTLDGCCEPPNALYTHDKRIGCCYSPNRPLTVGGNTRCCTPPDVNQSRWGQTETSPCGQFCTHPNSVLTDFGASSCCLSCNGERWNQRAEDVCGDCCPATSSVLYIGAYSSCCSTLSADQNRWGQTTSSVCGHICSAPYEVVHWQNLSSCCSSYPFTPANQTSSNICGDYCAAGQEIVRYGDSYSCCGICSKARAGQTETNVCGNWCLDCEPTVYAPSKSRCTPGDTGTFYVDAKAHCTQNKIKYQLGIHLNKGKYQITQEAGCWGHGGIRGDAKVYGYTGLNACCTHYAIRMFGTVPLPAGHRGNGYGYTNSTCNNEGTLNTSATTFTLYNDDGETVCFGFIDNLVPNQPDSCFDNWGGNTYRWTCIE